MNKQLAAVTAEPGPSLVIAGAGSGKNPDVDVSVAYLLEQGIPAVAFFCSLSRTRRRRK